MPISRAASAAVSLAVALAGVGLSAAPARADITRCVGAVGTEFAFACYTSPRFDHVGLGRTSVASVPVLCYGLGCTSPTLMVYVPGGAVGGRFTAVQYGGNSYVVYRPTAEQPYVLASNASALSSVNEVQVLALSAALDAANA